MLESIGHHEFLIFWIQLLALYSMARVLGSLAKRYGLPAVLGELSAGVVLGPTIFGKFWPDGFHKFLPESHGESVSEELVSNLTEAEVVMVASSHIQSGMLLAVSWFGAAFLLTVAGFETDLDLIKRLGKAATFVTAGSVIVPFFGGLAVGWFMTDSLFGVIDPKTGDLVSRPVFALFVAATVAVSALAVVAKILGDLGLMRRDVGQITLAAGMANDLIGWIILGVIAGLAAPEGLSPTGIAITTGGLLVFMALSLTLGQRVVDASLRAVRRNGRNVTGALSVTIAVMLVFGVITQALNLEAVLGTFFAGVVVARSRYKQIESEHIIEDLTTVIFAPLFFGVAGLRLDLWKLSKTEFMWAGILIAVALIFKFAGAYGGAKLAKLTNREAVLLGAGLNARGALEIIIASVGLSLGVFNDKAFALIVMVPLVTSFFSAVVLRIAGKDLKGSVAERERLASEEALAKNLLIKNKRLLLPTLEEQNSIVASQLATFAWPEQVAFSIMASSDDAHVEPISNVLYDRSSEKIIATKDNQAANILAQSQLGFGAIVVGAVEDPGHGTYVSPVVNQLLGSSSIPVVVVRKATNLPGQLPGIFARALVPVVASPSSRAAQELAANLSFRLGTNLMLSHVVSEPQDDGNVLLDIVKDTAFHHRNDGEKVLAQAHAYASGIKANSDTQIRFAESAAEEIVDHAAEIEADLIVIGAQLRKLDEGTASLGPTVNHVLEHAPQTVVVVAMPDVRPVN